MTWLLGVAIPGEDTGSIFFKNESIAGIGSAQGESRRLIESQVPLSTVPGGKRRSAKSILKVVDVKKEALATRLGITKRNNILKFQ